MFVNTPPLGWNTWNTFGANINEELILQAADAMIETGLKDAGYNYVVIDDIWALKERDQNGRLVPDPQKFPHGMKYIADYLHQRGLKFGMYSCAGYLTKAMAEWTGLKEGTPVAVEIMDSIASVPACQIDGPGKMLMIMGTSTCHEVLSAEERGVPGTCGIVKDGALPGSFCYEAGQSCVGDHFSWFVNRCLPSDYKEEAEQLVNGVVLLHPRNFRPLPFGKGKIGIEGAGDKVGL